MIGPAFFVAGQFSRCNSSADMLYVRPVDFVDKLTEFSGAAMILQDVTKFRLLDDVKTNLVGTVSHELKTPVGALSVLAETLADADEPAVPHVGAVVRENTGAPRPHLDCSEVEHADARQGAGVGWHWSDILGLAASRVPLRR